MDADAIGAEFVRQSRRQLAESVAMIRHCLDQLDDGQVWHRPRADMNSIANLLLHLAGNLRQRFGSVIDGEADDRDRLAEFTERRSIPKVELLDRFEAAVARADASMEKFDAARLMENRRYMLLSGPEEKSVAGVTIQAVAHLAGHAQEILHLTRMQLGEGYAFRQPGGVPSEMRPGR